MHSVKLFAALATTLLSAQVTAQSVPASRPPASSDTRPDSTASSSAATSTAPVSADSYTAPLPSAPSAYVAQPMPLAAAPAAPAAGYNPWSILGSVGTTAPPLWHPVKFERAPQSNFTEFYLIPAAVCDQIARGKNGCLQFIIDKGVQYGYGPSAIDSERNLRIADSYYILPICSNPPRWSHRIPVSVGAAQTSVVVPCPQ